MMNDRTKELLASLEDGIGNLTSSDEWQRYLATMAKFHRYSFGNVMLIMFQRPDATRVMGFGSKDGSTGWKSLGRSVRKGEHAIWILAPMTVRDREAEAEAGGKVMKVIGWKSVPVFDISQTDGDELPEPVKLLDGDEPEGLFAELTGVALSLGITSVTDADLGKANGVTYADGRIEIHPDRTGLQRVKTLAHEIGHWVLGHTTSECELTRGQRELEAESVAYVVMGQLGVDSGEYTFGYVAGWAGGEDAAKAQAGIRASGTRIQKAVGTVLGALEAAEQPEAVAA